MKPSPNDNSPQLQRPGAGLPWLEWVIARYFVFPRVCRKLDWKSASQKFQVEGERILMIWDELTTDQLTRPILIRRFAGIEDSSRNWSVAMTVAHLNTVGFRTLDVIAQLQTGEVPRSEVRIEDVKPTDDLSVAEVRSQFEQLQIKANSPEASVAVPRGQSPRYPHPWFGLLDAFQWHCLIAMHQGIHRKQIERIQDGLPLG